MPETIGGGRYETPCNTRQRKSTGRTMGSVSCHYAGLGVVGHRGLCRVEVDTGDELNRRHEVNKKSWLKWPIRILFMIIGLLVSFVCLFMFLRFAWSFIPVTDWGRFVALVVAFISFLFLWKPLVVIVQLFCILADAVLAKVVGLKLTD
jgi:hypothetical protein